MESVFTRFITCFGGHLVGKKNSFFHPLRLRQLVPSIRASKRPSHPVLPWLETSREILLPKKHVMFVQQKKGQIVSWIKITILHLYSSFIDQDLPEQLFQEKTHANHVYFPNVWIHCVALPFFCSHFAVFVIFSLRVEATQWSKLKERDSGGGIPIKPSISNGKKVSPISNMSTLRV